MSDAAADPSFAEKLYSATGPSLGWRNDLDNHWRMQIHSAYEEKAVKEAVGSLLPKGKKTVFDDVYTALNQKPAEDAPEYADYEWAYSPKDVELEQSDPPSADPADPADTAPAVTQCQIQSSPNLANASVGLFHRLKRPIIGKTTYTVPTSVVALERKQLALERAEQQTVDVKYANDLMHDVGYASITNYLCNLSMDLAMRSEALLKEECEAFGSPAPTLPSFGFYDENARGAEVPKTYRTRLQLSNDNTLTLALQTIDDVMLWASVDGERLRRLMGVLETKPHHFAAQNVTARGLVDQFRAPLRLDSATHVSVAKDVTLTMPALGRLLKEGLAIDLAASPTMLSAREMELEFFYDFDTRMLAVSRFSKQLDATKLSTHGLNHLAGETHERMVFEGMRDTIGSPLVYDALSVVESDVPTSSGLPENLDSVEYTKTYTLKSQPLIECCWRLRHRLLAWMAACNDRKLYRGARDMLTQAARLLDQELRKGTRIDEVDPLNTLLEQALLHASVAFASLTSEWLPADPLELGSEAVAHVELFLGLMASLDYGLGQGCGVSSCRGQMGVVLPAVKAVGLPLAAAIVKGPRRIPIPEINKELQAIATKELHLAEAPLQAGDLRAAEQGALNVHARRFGIATELAMRFVDAEHKCGHAEDKGVVSTRSDLLNDEDAFEWLGARMNTHDVLGPLSSRALQASERLWDASRLLLSEEQRDLALNNPKVRRVSPKNFQPKFVAPPHHPRHRTDPLAEGSLLNVETVPHSHRGAYHACAVDEAMQTTPTTLLQRALQTLIAFELQLTALRSHLTAGAYDGWQLRETLKVGNKAVDMTTFKELQSQYIEHVRQLLQRNRPLVQSLTQICARLQHAYTQSLGVWRLSRSERDAYLNDAVRTTLQAAKFMAHVASIFTVNDTHLSMPSFDAHFARLADTLDVGKALYDTPTLLRMLDPVPYRPQQVHRPGVNYDRMIARKFGRKLDEPAPPAHWSRREAHARGLQAAHVLISYAATHLLEPIERLELGRRFNVVMPSLWKALPTDEDPSGEQGALQETLTAFATSVRLLFDVCNDRLFETGSHGVLLRLCERVGCLTTSEAGFLHDIDAAGRARKQLWSLTTQVHLGDALVEHVEYERLLPSSAYNMIPPITTRLEGPSFARPFTPMSSELDEEVLRVASAAGVLATLLVAPTDHWMPSTVDAILMQPHARRDALCRIVCATPSVQDAKRALVDPGRVLRNRSASDDASFAPTLTSEEDPSGARMRDENDADGMATRYDELRAGLLPVRLSPFALTPTSIEVDEAVHQALLHCDDESMRPIRQLSIVGWYCLEEERMQPTLTLFPELQTELSTLACLSDLLLVATTETAIKTAVEVAPLTDTQQRHVTHRGFVRNADETMWVQVDQLERLQAEVSHDRLLMSAFSPMLVQTEPATSITTTDVAIDMCDSQLTMHQVATSYNQVDSQVRQAWVEAIPTALFASALIASVQAKRINAMIDEAHSRLAMPLTWLRAKGMGDLLLSFNDAMISNETNYETNNEASKKYMMTMVANALNMVLFHEVDDVPNPTLVERRVAQFESDPSQEPNELANELNGLDKLDPTRFSNDSAFFVKSQIPIRLLDELLPAPRPIGVMHDEVDRRLRQVIKNTSRLVTMGFLLVQADKFGHIPQNVIDGIFVSFFLQLYFKYQVTAARQDVITSAEGNLANNTFEKQYEDTADVPDLMKRMRQRLAVRLTRSKTPHIVLPCLTWVALTMFKYKTKITSELQTTQSLQSLFQVIIPIYLSMLNDELYAVVPENTHDPMKPGQEGGVDWAILQAAVRQSLPVAVGVKPSKAPNTAGGNPIVVRNTRIALPAVVFVANAACVALFTSNHKPEPNLNWMAIVTSMTSLATASLYFIDSRFVRDSLSGAFNHVLTTWNDPESGLDGSMRDTDPLAALVADDGRTAWVAQVTGAFFTRPTNLDLLPLDVKLPTYVEDILEGAFVGAMEASMWCGGVLLLKSGSPSVTEYAIPLSLGVLSLSSPSAALGAVISSGIQDATRFGVESPKPNDELAQLWTENVMRTVLAGAVASGVQETIDRVVEIHLSVYAERLFQQVSNSLSTIMLLLIQIQTTPDKGATSDAVEHSQLAVLASTATFTLATQLAARRRHAIAGRHQRFNNNLLQFGLRVFALVVSLSWWYSTQTANSTSFTGVDAPPPQLIEESNGLSAHRFVDRLNGIYLQLRTAHLRPIGDRGHAVKEMHHANRIPQARWKTRPTHRVKDDLKDDLKDDVKDDVSSDLSPVSIGMQSAEPPGANPAPVVNKKSLDIHLLCDPKTALQTLKAGLGNQTVSAALWTTTQDVYANTVEQDFANWLNLMKVKDKNGPIIVKPTNVDQIRGPLQAAGYELFKLHSKNEYNLIRLFEGCHGTKFGLLYNPLKTLLDRSLEEQHQQMQKLVLEECKRAQPKPSKSDDGTPSDPNAPDEIKRKKAKQAEDITKAAIGAIVSNSFNSEGEPFDSVYLTSLITPVEDTKARLSVAAALPLYDPKSSMMQPHLIEPLIRSAAWAYREALQHADLRLLPNLPVDDVLSGNAARLAARIQLIQSVIDAPLDTVDPLTKKVDPLTKKVVFFARLARGAAACQILDQTLTRSPPEGQGFVKVSYKYEGVSEKEYTTLKPPGSALQSLADTVSCFKITGVTVEGVVPKSSSSLSQLVNAFYTTNQDNNGSSSDLPKRTTSLYRDCSNSSLQAGTEMLLGKYEQTMPKETTFTQWYNQLKSTNAKQFVLRNARADGTKVVTTNAWAQEDLDLVSAAHLEHSGGSYAHVVLAHSLQSIAMAHTLHRQQTVKAGEVASGAFAESSKTPMIEYDTMVRLMATRPLDRGNIEPNASKILGLMSETTGLTVDVVQQVFAGEGLSGFGLFFIAIRLLYFMTDLRSTSVVLNDIQRDRYAPTSLTNNPVWRVSSLALDSLLRIGFAIYVSHSPNAVKIAIAHCMFTIYNEAHACYGQTHQARALAEATEMAVETWFNGLQKNIRGVSDLNATAVQEFRDFRRTAACRSGVRRAVMYGAPPIAMQLCDNRVVSTLWFVGLYALSFMYDFVTLEVTTPSSVVDDETTRDVDALLDTLMQGKKPVPWNLINRPNGALIWKKIQAMNSYNQGTYTQQIPFLGRVTVSQSLLAVVASKLPPSWVKFLKGDADYLINNAPIYNDAPHSSGTSTRLELPKSDFQEELLHQIFFRTKPDEQMQALINEMLTNIQYKSYREPLKQQINKFMQIYKEEFVKRRLTAEQEVDNRFDNIRRHLQKIEKLVNLLDALVKVKSSTPRRILQFPKTKINPTNPVCADDAVFDEYVEKRHKQAVTDLLKGFKELANQTIELTEEERADLKANLTKELEFPPGVTKNLPWEAQLRLAEVNRYQQQGKKASDALLTSNGNQIHKAYAQIMPQSPQQTGALYNFERAKTKRNRQTLLETNDLVNKLQELPQVQATGTTPGLDASYSWKRRNIQSKNPPSLANLANLAAVRTMFFAPAALTKNTMPIAFTGAITQDSEEVLTEIPFLLDTSDETNGLKQAVLPLLQPVLNGLAPEGIYVEVINELLNTLAVAVDDQASTNEIVKAVNEFLKEGLPLKSSVDFLNKLHGLLSDIVPSSTQNGELATILMTSGYLKVLKHDVSPLVDPLSVPVAPRIGEVVSSLTQTLLYLGDIRAKSDIHNGLHTAFQIAMPDDHFFRDILRHWKDHGSSTHLMLPRVPSASPALTILNPSLRLSNTLRNMYGTGTVASDYVGLAFGSSHQVSELKDASLSDAKLYELKDAAATPQLVLTSPVLGRMLLGAISQGVARAQAHTSLTLTQSPPTTLSYDGKLPVLRLTAEQFDKRSSDLNDALLTCLNTPLNVYTPPTSVRLKGTSELRPDVNVPLKQIQQERFVMQVVDATIDVLHNPANKDKIVTLAESCDNLSSSLDMEPTTMNQFRSLHSADVLRQGFGKAKPQSILRVTTEVFHSENTPAVVTFPTEVSNIDAQVNLLLETFRNTSVERMVDNYEMALILVQRHTTGLLETEEESLKNEYTALNRTTQTLALEISKADIEAKENIRQAFAKVMSSLMKNQAETSQAFKMQNNKLEFFIQILEARTRLPETSSDDMETLKGLLSAAKSLQTMMNELQNNKAARQPWHTSLENMDPSNGQLFWGLVDPTNKVTDETAKITFGQSVPLSSNKPQQTATELFNRVDQSTLANTTNTTNSPNSQPWTESDPTLLMLSVSMMRFVGKRRMARLTLPWLQGHFWAPTAALALQALTLCVGTAAVLIKPNMGPSTIFFTDWMYQAMSLITGFCIYTNLIDDGLLTSDAMGQAYSRVVQHVAFEEQLSWSGLSKATRNGVIVVGDAQKGQDSSNRLALIDEARLINGSSAGNSGEISISECVQLEAIYEAVALTLRARMVRLADYRSLKNNPGQSVSNNKSENPELQAVNAIDVGILRACSGHFGLLLHGLENPGDVSPRMKTSAYDGYHNSPNESSTQTLYKATSFSAYASDLSMLSKSYVVDALLTSTMASRQFSNITPDNETFDPIDRYGTYYITAPPGEGDVVNVKTRLNRQLSMLLSNVQTTCQLPWYKGGENKLHLEELCRLTLGGMYDTARFDKQGVERLATKQRTRVADAIKDKKRTLDEDERYVRESFGLVTHPSLDISYNVSSQTNFNRTPAPVSQVARARMRKDLANGLYGLREVFMASLFGCKNVRTALTPLIQLAKQTVWTSKTSIRVQQLRSTYLTQAARLYGRIFVLRNAEAEPLEEGAENVCLRGRALITNVNGQANNTNMGFHARFLKTYEKNLSTGVEGWSHFGYMLLCNASTKLGKRPNDVFDVLDTLERATKKDDLAAGAEMLTNVIKSIEEQSVPSEGGWAWYRVLLHDVNVLLPSSVWSDASSTP